MCSALGSPAKRAPSRTVFCSSPGSASPAVCLHSSRSSSPVTLPPFINRLRRTSWTCYHSAHTVLSRPDGNTSSGRSRTHCSVGATCFINSNEGAAEGSESQPCAVRCLHSAVWTLSGRRNLSTLRRYSGDIVLTPSWSTERWLSDKIMVGADAAETDRSEGCVSPRRGQSPKHRILRFDPPHSCSLTQCNSVCSHTCSYTKHSLSKW